MSQDLTPVEVLLTELKEWAQANKEYACNQHKDQEVDSNPIGAWSSSDMMNSYWRGQREAYIKMEIMLKLKEIK